MVYDPNTTQYNVYSPYLISLERLNWKVFGTVTFRDKSKRKATPRSTALRNDDFYRLLDNSFYKLKVNQDIVPYFFRHEGSLVDGWHIHFVIADCKALRGFSARAICAEMNSSWHRDFRGIRGINGTSQIDPYDPKKEGLKYVCKLDKYDSNNNNAYCEYFYPSEALKNLVRETDIGNPGVIIPDANRFRI